MKMIYWCCLFISISLASVFGFRYMVNKKLTIDKLPKKFEYYRSPDSSKAIMPWNVTQNLYGLSACHLKTDKEQESSETSTVLENRVDIRKKIEQHKHSGQMTFVKYNNEGEYFQLLASKGDSTLSFVNETDTRKNLNCGDQIQITWKDHTITILGDNGAKIQSQVLVSVKKISDGPLPAFRKKYGKKLKYTWSTDDNYSSGYLDKIYLLTEYYLSKTKNPLLQTAVKNRQDLTYSIEPTERYDRKYNVVGIAPVGSNGSQIVQWLYIVVEDNRIFEYDLKEDRLIAFH